ncbi:ribosome silencing factor [Chakrabartyella piscis]|uniref:ribosome silencing factor n=1 Tax=Chakrabartyella piscis TaxID=2918914 RepID=UPI0029583246|nr:ribosome silencing factor [Chakrabartyella piscis]
MSNFTTLEVAKKIETILDDKIAQDIRVLDLQGLSNIADFFVIANGNTASHLRALADDLDEKLKADGIKVFHTEGYNSGTWILLDFGGVLVHLFNKEQREFYGLDRIWSDAKLV